MYYLGELARKPYARQEVLGSNPVVCKKNFNVRHLLSRFYHPEQKPRLLSRKSCPGSKIGTKASLKPGQNAESVVSLSDRPTGASLGHASFCGQSPSSSPDTRHSYCRQSTPHVLQRATNVRSLLVLPPSHCSSVRLAGLQVG